MNIELDQDIRGFIDSADGGLWGLVSRSLAQHGDDALLNDVLKGRALVQIEVIYTTAGMTAEGYLVGKNGLRTSLFHLTSNQPSPPDEPSAPKAPPALHLVH